MECGLSAAQLGVHALEAALWLIALVGATAIGVGLWRVAKKLRAQRLIVSWADRPIRAKRSVKKAETLENVTTPVIEAKPSSCTKTIVLTAVLTAASVAAVGLIGYMGYLVISVGG